ncbi:MAG: hypothetical protein RLZZ258_737 [Actinomycetota bacterium]|jgi:hypothetical protein
MSTYTPTTRFTRPTTRVQTVPAVSAQGRRFLRTVLVLAVATAAGLSAVTGLGAGSATATGSTSSVEFKYVTISAGQTLWSLAALNAPEQDPRDWIAEVIDLNGLTTAELAPGQRIALPAN